MICRDVAEFSDRIEENFDYYNDTDDTARYLRRIGRHDLAERLLSASKRFWEQRTAEFKATRTWPQTSEG